MNIPWLEVTSSWVSTCVVPWRLPTWRAFIATSRASFCNSCSGMEWQLGIGEAEATKIRSRTVYHTWWLIPLSKWVITPVISGLTLLIPFITVVITHLLSGMSHQVGKILSILRCIWEICLVDILSNMHHLSFLIYIWHIWEISIYDM